MESQMIDPFQGIILEASFLAFNLMGGHTYTQFTVHAVVM